jgi:hypothetical protein
VKTTRYAAALGIVLASALLAAGCDNSYGVFSTIQKETSANKDSTFKKTAVANLVTFNGSYYAQLDELYVRPTASSPGTNWTVFEPAVFGADYSCSGVAASSNYLYVAVRNGKVTATHNGIFRLDTSGTWNHIYSGSENIQSLCATSDGTIFVVTMDSSTPTFSLKYLNGSNLDPVGGVFAGTSAPPTNVVLLGGQYYAAVGSAIYHGGSSSTITTLLAAGPTVTVGCLATDGTNLFAGTRLTYTGSTQSYNGYVYMWNGSWGTPQAATSSTKFGVTAMVAVNKGASTILIAGNEYQGYYESDYTSGSLGAFTAGDSSAAYVSSTSNYDSSLQYLPVYNFSYDGANNRLFVCASSTASTSGYAGLWSNLYDGSSAWGGWVSE